MRINYKRPKDFTKKLKIIFYFMKDFLDHLPQYCIF